MLTTPMSRGKLLIVVAIIFVLALYIKLTYTNQNRSLPVVTFTREYIPVTPTVLLNVSEITSKVIGPKTQSKVNQTSRVENLRYSLFDDYQDIDYFNVIPKPLELCPEVPPGLSETAPLIIPTIETLEGVGKNLSWLVIRHGGHNTPIDCISRYKIAIIVPYRDRLQNLCTFLLNIHLFLTKQQLDYTIFVVEQFDGKLFNRGMLMNVGFVEALKLSEFDCFFFHDVDLIPENENNIYSCPQQPRHMSVAVDKLDYKLPHDNIFGGVIGISRHHFQLVNGFSNRFWGWGGEDDDLASRVKFHDLHITRYPSNIARYRMLNHVQQAINPHRFELLLSGQKWFKTDGLNSLKYQIKSVERLPLYTHVLVDLTKS